MKIKDIKSKEGRNYAQTWVNALKVLLGWSQKRTLAWAEEFSVYLNDEDDLFFHWTPSDYLIRLIIPKALDEALSADERLELRKLLLGIIERNGIFSCEKPNYDWHLAKRLIARVLRHVERLKVGDGKNVERVLRSKRRKLEARIRLRARKRSKISEKELRAILRQASV